MILEVRTSTQFEEEERRIPGAIRGRPDEATSARVARRPNRTGFRAAALVAGYDAWKEEYPVEPYPATVGEPAGSRPGA